MQEGLAEKLVEGIMPPDVFSHRLKLTVRSEQRCSMQAACLSENCLRWLKLLRERAKNIRVDRKVIVLRQRAKSSESHERSFSADATT